jgi:hypothetical protein
MIVCIQCSMRALLDDQPSPAFDETLEAHMARCHPDPVATQQERKELERRLAERFKSGTQ